MIEPSHCLDPLSILLAREDASEEVDMLESMYLAGRHRRATMELDNLRSDNLGATQQELAPTHSYFTHRRAS